MLSQIKYQLYLLQLESYEIGRYYRLLIARGFWPGKNQRGRLKLTPKAWLLLIVAVAIHLSLSAQLAWMVMARLDALIATIAFAAFLFFGCAFYFIFYSLALIIVWPVQFAAKRYLINRAKNILKKNAELKVIAVAGSYGKTTAKAALFQLLSGRFEAASTPESINTPIGIARYIIKNVSSKTEVLIVEMGEHYQGDIAELCRLVSPDIGVITGINESHLERLADMKTAVSTIFELAGGLKKDGQLIINIDDQNIRENYSAYCKNVKVKFYSGKNNADCPYQISDYAFDRAGLKSNFTIARDGEQASISSAVLGEYIKELTVLAAMVGNIFGLDLMQSAARVNDLQPVEHRLKPVANSRGLLIIDDGYNGNPRGVSEAITLLKKFTDRRKVFVTPGLVEMGKSAKTVHYNIGKELAGAADLVLLIKNSVTEDIAIGLRDAGFDANNIIWFSSATEAHEQLGKVLRPGDAVLFQNDWGDQYI